MIGYKTAALLALTGLAGAAPLEERAALPSAVCLAVNAVVDILKVYPSATPFCSSVLAIPTITTTKTVSTTASFTSSITTTVPVTVTTYTSSAVPVTVYSSTSTTITTCIPAAVNKRDIQKRATTTASATSSGLCAGYPNVLKGIACSEVSSACSCLNIPTPTSTSTVTQTISTTAYPTTTVYSSVTATTVITGTTTIPTTSTSTVNYCPTPVSCNNEGIRWAFYTNNIYNADSYYSNYDPTVIKTETPGYQATASVCGGLDESDVGEISIYGSSQQFESDYFTLNHVGYIFAEVTGTYTFTLTNADDIALLWLGSKAYSGWNRDNADATAIVHTTPSSSFSYTLQAEQYLPFRIVFGQAQGAVSFFLSVAAPDGTVILDSNTQNSPFLVQYSCDGVTAPPFPAFGTET